MEEEEDNLETFCLIWLDTLVNNSQEKLTIQRQLRSSINSLKTFVDEYQCETYIESTSDDDRIVLIVSGQLGKDFVPRIHQLRQISSIYVFCADRKKHEIWTNQYRKIKCVITQLDELVSQIEYEQKRHNQNKTDEPFSFNIFKENADNELIYSQFLINSLLQMKSISKDKHTLLDLCRNIYRQNENELTQIDEFENSYSSSRSLWWLTRDSFISKLLPKAFRMKNFNLLFLFRFFLQDIFEQLKQNKCLKSFRVYRSQILSTKQLNFLQNSIGEILSINSFLSTNLVRKQSLSSLKESIINENYHRILFEIDADPKLNNIKPFANITSMSYSIGEQQILFMSGAIFRIMDIHQDQNQISIIQMSLCTDKEQELKLVYNPDEFDLISFGHLLMDMRKFDQAKIYFNHLIHVVSDNSSDMIICCNALGNILYGKDQYDSSVKWYQKSLEIKMRILHRNDPTIASTYNDIAFVYLKKNDYKRALESYHVALEIFQKNFGEDHPHITECYNNIALVYKNEQKYEDALEFYNKSLLIHEKYPSKVNHDLAMSHTNVGVVHRHLDQFDFALEHYNQALKIYEQILPPQHLLTSMIFEYIGNIYYDKSQFDQGLLYYEKAAHIYRNLLPSKHPDVLQIGMIIRRIELKLKSINFNLILSSRRTTVQRLRILKS